MTTDVTGIERGQRRVGTVVSNRSDKTIVVRVDAVRRHPIYRKAVRVRRKLLAHDAENECEIGDVVEITDTRPYSRRKRWRLKSVVKRAALTEEEQAAIAIASEEAARAAEVVSVEDDEETDESQANDESAAEDASVEDDEAPDGTQENEETEGTDADEGDETSTELNQAITDSEQESDTAAKSS